MSLHIKQFAEPHKRHSEISISLKILQIFQLSRRVNIRLGNRASVLRTEITPSAREITIHTK